MNQFDAFNYGKADDELSRRILAMITREIGKPNTIVKYTKFAFSREQLECDKRIKTNVTDADMLRLQIDAALDANDKELFMSLTKEMEGLKC